MNREIAAPSTLYPLTGDIASQAGSPTVTVVGLQGRPVENPFLQGGEDLQYDINSNTWIPTLRACILVDNVPVSDDFIITVNEDNQITVDGV